MKKLTHLLLGIFLLGTTTLIKAQCYGVVHYDQSATANGLSTFTINTTFANELIMIAYNGWSGPGAGPVTVDGNAATHINTAHTANDACAEAYCYLAPTAGAHNIVCTETGYALFNPPNYILNFAESFYETGSCIPLSCGSVNTIEVATSSSNVSSTITTTTPNEMIFSSFVYNTGIFNAYSIVATGATVTQTLHVGDGIDASEGYTSAPTTGVYNINTSDVNQCCGGGTVLVAIVPGPCTSGVLTVAPTVSNPTCGNCNGSIGLVIGGGSAPYTYTWSPNVSTTSSATGLCAGTYSVNVRDATCHDTNLVYTLTSTSITVSANVTNNEPCNGNCVGSASSTVVGGVAPLVYAWTPSGGNNATANTLCAGTYTISVHDANGCTGTASVTITEPALLTGSIAVTNALCFGANGSETCTPAGGTAPYNYSWLPSGGNGATATVTAGTYTVNVTDANGCTASVSATITQPTALAVNVTGPSMVCIGASGILTANTTGGTAPYAYAWSPGIASTTNTATITPLSTLTYTVVVTDANGCSASGQITVPLGPQLYASISAPTSACSGMPVTLCATAAGGTGGNIYQWQPGNYSTPCITLHPTSTNTYTISIVDNCGTTATATATVLVNPLPLVNFNANLYQGCAPLCVQFYNSTTISQGGLAQYLWTFGNGDTVQSQSPIYCYKSNGTYDVSLTATSDSGCSATLNKAGLIKAYAHPNAVFTVSPQAATIIAPTIQFTDKSSGVNPVMYWTWNFGDGSDSSSNLKNPTHTYQDTGRFCANLTIMDSHGCSDTATNCLVIDPVFNLYIPSAFTPNGDGKNETFQPKGQYIKNFEMFIFDRWGAQLYHTTDITKGWNGVVNGTIAQQDTYEYKILVTDAQNKQHSYIGNVTLIK